MYEDFFELRSGAAEELERDLNAALRERSAAGQAHDTTGGGTKKVECRYIESNVSETPKSK